MNWLFWAKAIGSDQMPLGMSNAIYHSDKSPWVLCISVS